VTRPAGSAPPASPCSRDPCRRSWSTRTGGKLSLALDLSQDEGRDILYKLAAISDVFLTNKMPGVRAKLKTDIDDIKAHNPNNHLRLGFRLRRSRPRPRRRRLRHPRLLVPRHEWAQHQAP